MQQNLDVRNLISVVAQCVGVELLGRELSSDELACIARSVARVGLDKNIAFQRTKLTPPQVAKMLGVNADKVLAWVRNGELRAVNTAVTTTGRPRYRIDREDLRDFERRRSMVPQPTVIRRRKGSSGDEVIKFF